MQATRFWVMTHCVLLLGSAALLCCGKDEGISGYPTAVGGASGGAEEPASGGPSRTPTAGSESGGTANGGGGTAGGGASTPTGGGTATGGGGTNSTHAGSGGVSEPAGGAASAGAGAPPLADGGAGPLPEEQLTLCDRLTQRSTHAFNVARDYDHAVYDDCRTKWVAKLYLAANARVAFLNELQVWSMAFWGCSKTSVQTFALVYGTPALTAGDAAALIEKYMTVAKAELQLSPAEAEEMQAALERLSQQDITDPSLELSGSLCVAGGGGAAGANGGAP